MKYSIPSFWGLSNMIDKNKSISYYCPQRKTTRIKTMVPVLLNCDVSHFPFTPPNLQIENPENGTGLGVIYAGTLEWPTEIELFQTAVQKEGRHVSRKIIKKELADKMTLSATLLDFAVINQRWSFPLKNDSVLRGNRFVPEHWWGKHVVFATTYCHPIGHLFLRELFFDGLIWNHQVRPFTEFGPEDYFAILKKLERS